MVEIVDSRVTAGRATRGRFSTAHPRRAIRLGSSTTIGSGPWRRTTASVPGVYLAGPLERAVIAKAVRAPCLRAKCPANERRRPSSFLSCPQRLSGGEPLGVGGPYGYHVAGGPSDEA